jgi:four helix bundle protein
MGTLLDHEKLEVYQKALRFFGIADRIAERLSRRNDMRDQLQRASGSIVNNTAEGAGEFSPREKARFYRMARRSAIECAATLDSALEINLIAADEKDPAREQLVMIVGGVVNLIKSCEARARDAGR